MDSAKLYLTDPKTKEKSVSLTLMLVSFILALVAGGLEMAGLVKGTSISLELFWGTAGLYFGRKFTTRGQSVGVEAATAEPNKE